MSEPDEDRVEIQGSERAPVAGARAVGPPDKPEIRVTVVLTDEATDADRQTLRDFATAYDLTVADESPRLVKLVGPPQRLAEAFGTQLDLVDAPDLGLFRRREGPLTIPRSLSAAVHAVLGLDDRPQARAHFRIAPLQRAVAQSFAPKELAVLYGFPTGATGEGVTVGIIELGGGFDTTDLATYWDDQGITPAPTVEAVGVDGADNSPGDDADAEVMLDIEVVGSVAPGAHMNVYFAPNTDAGFLDAIDAAARQCSVVSISWGAPEDSWTASARSSFDLVLKDAGQAGVTVTAASGDDGSSDNLNDGQSHVDFPAASPNVLGCGGTRVTASAGAISDETVWNAGGGATGGGVSRFFALPGYQQQADVPAQADTGRPGRGVPDVAGDADPATGYEVRVNGQDTVIGGTSAVAPLWAGLIALINEGRDAPVGFVNPRLYAAGVQRDIQQGDNGTYAATPGWDACTGLGSPDGAKVADALA